MNCNNGVSLVLLSISSKICDKPFSYSWFREIEGHLQPVHSSARFEPSQDILYIRRLKSEDAGRWTCKVSNSFGEQRLDIRLTVTAHLSVHVLPQLQVFYTILFQFNISIMLFSGDKLRRECYFQLHCFGISSGTDSVV